MATVNPIHTYNFLLGAGQEEFVVRPDFSLVLPDLLIDTAMCRQNRSPEEHYVSFKASQCRRQVLSGQLSYIGLSDLLTPPSEAPSRDKRLHLGAEMCNGFLMADQRVVFYGMTDVVAVIGHENHRDFIRAMHLADTFVEATKFYGF